MAIVSKEIRFNVSKAISHDNFQELLQGKVAEVACEPEYSWGNDFRSFMTDGDGRDNRS